MGPSGSLNAAISAMPQGFWDTSDEPGAMISASGQEFLERFGKGGMLLWGIELEVLAEVILSLYEDPANSYIPFSDMVSIAQDKLNGKAVEEDLIQARRTVELVERVVEGLKEENP